jgi:hypothetical protein
MTELDMIEVSGQSELPRPSIHETNVAKHIIGKHTLIEPLPLTNNTIIYQGDTQARQALFDGHEKWLPGVERDVARMSHRLDNINGGPAAKKNLP